MNTSLSVLLPVHNAQYRLEEGVARLLDVLPELTHSFDLVIVDDGSTDDTTDIARDLATRYPQVSMVRHPVPLGLAEAIQTGLDHSDGEVVFVGDERHGLDAVDLHELWQLRDDDEVVAPGPTASSAPRSTLLGKRHDWHSVTGKSVRRPKAQLQMIRRGTVEELRLLGDPSVVSAQHRVDGEVSADHHVPPARPNFLNKIKRFALGE